MRSRYCNGGCVKQVKSRSVADQRSGRLSTSARFLRPRGFTVPREITSWPSLKPSFSIWSGGFALTVDAFASWITGPWGLPAQRGRLWPSFNRVHAGGARLLKLDIKPPAANAVFGHHGRRTSAGRHCQDKLADGWPLDGRTKGAGINPRRRRHQTAPETGIQHDRSLFHSRPRQPVRPRQRGLSRNHRYGLAHERCGHLAKAQVYNRFRFLRACFGAVEIRRATKTCGGPRLAEPDSPIAASDVWQFQPSAPHAKPSKGLRWFCSGARPSKQEITLREHG